MLKRRTFEKFVYLCTRKRAKLLTLGKMSKLFCPRLTAALSGRKQIPDENLVNKVKQACKMIVGVASVKVQKPAKEKEFDITKTAGYREAMDDVKNGRVTHYESLKDFYKEMGL